MKRTTVLVTGVGSGVAQSIIKALRFANLTRARGYRILGADALPTAAGLYRVDKGFVVPPCTEEEYITRLVDICQIERVDVVIPGSDPEVEVLAKDRKFLEQVVDAQVLVSPYETVCIGMDKWETFLFLRDHGFRFPMTATPVGIQGLLNATTFPLIAKPGSGSGSVGLYKVHNHKELDALLPILDEGYVIQECLLPDDEEYTTGVVFDAKGQVIDSITMWRRLKKGSSYLAKVVDKPEVLDEMEAIASELEVVGSINLQCRLTKDGPVVFEINPRFSGTSAARAVAGMNGVDISIRHLLFGEHPARSKKRPITMIRHLAEIYVSEDDILATERRGVTETRGEVYGYF